MTPEQKKQRIETIVKILAFAGFLIILGPLYLTLLHGMVALAALAVASGVSFIIINLIPAFARLVGNWRLKALKAVAAANPIENLELIYEDKQKALAASRENINQSYAVLQDLYNQICQHDQDFPGKPSQWLDKYSKLKALIELRGEKYKQAKKNLEDFGEVIKEKRSDWKIAQTMAAANKLANVGEDFESKLMQDTALTTIQDGLNNAFAELDTSLLDEAPTVKSTVTVAPPSTNIKTIPESSITLPTLNLEEVGTSQPEYVSVKSNSKRKNKI